MDKKEKLLPQLLAYAGKRKVLTYLSLVIAGISQLFGECPLGTAQCLARRGAGSPAPSTVRRHPRQAAAGRRHTKTTKAEASNGLGFLFVLSPHRIHRWYSLVAIHSLNFR